MEALAEQPPKIETHDHEIRAYNDATTWLAETLEGSMRTPFEYRFDGQELYAEDGEPLKTFFDKGILEAEILVRQNPSLSFERRRRWLERQEYVDMLKMASGDLPNTMVVTSDFPPELMQADRDMGGYNVTRKQTMLRVISWQNGRLTMYSQSLDGSNRRALEAIHAYLGFEPQPGELLGQRRHVELPPDRQAWFIDELTGVYDRSFSAQFGGNWYAGRQDVQRVNTYDFVCRQPDLVGLLADEFAAGKYDSFLKFGIAAKVEKRFQTPDVPTANQPAQAEYLTREALLREVAQAALEAKRAGKVFSGCGASVDGDLTAEEQLKETGFGNKAALKDCDFISKECPKCHQKNVKTTAKNGRYYGACGCKS